MEDGDPDADQRTFRIDFSGEGLARLRGRINEKLKDFLGDYTDDTLAEYVIVLLKNGRSKEAARKELNVFLEDDSVAFVSWLWDHLSSNMNFYVHNNQSLVDEAANVKSNLEGRSRRSSDWLYNASGNVPMDSDDGRKGLVKTAGSRRNREWRGLSQAETSTTILRSTRSDNISSEEKLINQHSPIKRSPSPRPHIHEKRKRQDEREMPKKDVSSKPVLRAPSRLLQFAVRDAVRTVQQAATRKEPALKRLRSVVSASTMDQVTDTNRRTRSVVQVPGGIATALRAAAEAANDVTRSRSSRNVFNRLGHGKDEVHVSKETSSPRVCMSQEEKYEDIKHDHMSDDWYIERNEVDGESVVDTMMADEEAGMTSDSSEEDDGYDHVNIPMHKAIEASQHKSISSAFQEKDAVMVKSSIAENIEVAARKSQVEEQDSPPASTQSAPHKVVNISVNVNTWKAPYHQPKEEIIAEAGNQMTAQKTETGERNLAASLPTESNLKLQKPVNDPTCSGAQKDAQKSVVSTTASYSTTSRPLEDAHSRTIFVSNVHFAATKDTLSRHFNKFGEVLKVVIMTDAATGQSKGSAYVEFLRKESAELALSLNGTSFMSRILKVVRSSSYHEAAAMMSWPRSAWNSSYPSRIARLPFPRGVMGGAFRGRLPIKPGARSLQWKREAPTNPSNDASKNVQSTQSVGNTLASPTGRSLTYVRSEAKSDANSAPV